MARHRKDLGARKNVRVDLYKTGFLIPAPDAPWIECVIVDVSDNGACLDIGTLAVPEIFGLAFTAGGEGIRVWLLVLSRGELFAPPLLPPQNTRWGFFHLVTPPNPPLPPP